MALSDSERDTFRKEIDLTSNDVSSTVALLLLDGVSPYGVVFGLLKVAAFIARMTGCPQDVFAKLANVAYKANTKVSGIDQYLDQAKNPDKPKDPPN